MTDKMLAVAGISTCVITNRHPAGFRREDLQFD